jgi:hypothetical protein
MIKKLRYSIVCCLMLRSLLWPASAQNATGLRGTVSAPGEAGELIVRITAPLERSRRYECRPPTCTLTVKGEYRLVDVRPGEYDVIACPSCRPSLLRKEDPNRYHEEICEATGHQPQVRARLLVQPGRTVNVPPLVLTKESAPLTFHQIHVPTPFILNKDTLRVEKGGQSIFVDVIHKATACKIARIVTDKAGRFLFPGEKDPPLSDDPGLVRQGPEAVFAELDNRRTDYSYRPYLVKTIYADVSDVLPPPR